MRRATDLIKKLAEVSAHNFFLRKHQLLPSTLKLLGDLYPSVDWKRVDFYEGLAWFTPLVAPYVTAQALPRFYSLGGYRIYLKKFDESRSQCLADIVHEGFHIMQAMQFANGYGLGFLRGLMVYYNAFFIKHGYRQNPFEVPAYDQEFRFLDLCNKNNISLITLDVHPKVMAEIAEESSLIFSKYEFKFKGNYPVLACSFMFCLFIAFIKPLADLLVFTIRLIVKSI